ncbi:MAG: efflux RND transporter periplasmic adaptor subunit [Paracoccaceae bacterium]
MRICLVLTALLALAACKEDAPEKAEIVRGLKTFTVAETIDTSVRRYPAVIEPSEITALSFEAGGTIGTIDLDVGQRVSEGQVVARIDTASLQLQVDSADASVRQATAVARNARENLERQVELLERGATTRVVVDTARTETESAEAALTQARKSLETAEDNLGKAELKAPFDGIVNTVDISSFSTVAAGTPIASLYRSDTFEVSFSVNFDTVNRLVVGTRAIVRLADAPEISLAAVVSEIGSRADAVSSFPIVLQLTETNPLLKAGMAVEAAIAFPLARAEGYPIPLSAVIKDGAGKPASGSDPSTLGVYVFDASSGTVARRMVTVGGIRQNSIIVLDGLEPGDVIASAGVSFLREGQKVKPLDGEG